MCESTQYLLTAVLTRIGAVEAAAPASLVSEVGKLAVVAGELIERIHGGHDDLGTQETTIRALRAATRAIAGRGRQAAVHLDEDGVVTLFQIADLLTAEADLLAEDAANLRAADQRAARARRELLDVESGCLAAFCGARVA